MNYSDKVQDAQEWSYIILWCMKLGIPMHDRNGDLIDKEYLSELLIEFRQAFPGNQLRLKKGI